MTRKEQIEKAAMQIGGVHPDWSALECFQMGYKEGAKWADKTMIEKLRDLKGGYEKDLDAEMGVYEIDIQLCAKISLIENLIKDLEE